MTCEVKTAILYLSWTAFWQIEWGPLDLLLCFQRFDLFYTLNAFASPTSKVMTYRWRWPRAMCHPLDYRLSDPLFAVYTNHDLRLKTTTMCLPDGVGSNQYAPMLSGMCFTSNRMLPNESWPIVEDDRNVPSLGLPSIWSSLCSTQYSWPTVEDDFDVPARWSGVQSICSYAFRDVFYVNLNASASPISRVTTYRWRRPQCAIYEILSLQYTAVSYNASWYRSSLPLA